MKKMFSAILAVFIVSGLFVVAAEETPSDGGSSGCRITFSLEDDTGGSFKDDVVVTLKDNAGDKKYTFTLTSDNSYGANVPFDGGEVVSDVTYRVFVAFPSDAGYAITNRNGSQILFFPSVEDSHDFLWKITPIDVAPGAKPTQGQSDGDVLTEEIDYTEADTLFSIFLDAVSHIEGNKEWNHFFLNYSADNELFAEKFEMYGLGSTEDWKAFSDYERFLWYETYIRMLVLLDSCIDREAKDILFGSEQNFLNRSVVSIIHGFKLLGDGTEMDAYQNLMLWQYYHFIDTGSFYNFLTGYESLEALNQPAEPENSGQQEVVQPTAPESSLALADGSDVVKENEDTGIWGKFLSMAKAPGFLVSIVLIVVLLAAVFIVVSVRKSREIRDDG